MSEWITQARGIFLVPTARRVSHTFLGKLQLQLALSPQPKVPNEPVTVSNDTGLTLKVEGVVVRAGRAGLFRSPRRVVVHVASTQLSHARTVSADAKVNVTPFGHSLTQLLLNENKFTNDFLDVLFCPFEHSCLEARVWRCCTVNRTGAA